MTAKPRENNLKLGDLAELTDLSVRALHHYDEIGLLLLSGGPQSGHRLYSAQCLRSWPRGQGGTRTVGGHEMSARPVGSSAGPRSRSRRLSMSRRKVP